MGFAEMPLWVSLVGAVFAFLVVKFIPPLLGGSSLTGRMLGQALSSFAAWAAGLILLAGLGGAGKRWFRRHQAARVTGLDALRKLDWSAFEAHVAETFRRQGYTVVERGGRQPDGGVDLELHRGTEKILVQCKHWVNRPVPVQRVRELLGVVTAEAADRAILVGSGGFTPDAKRFAKGQPIQLVDGEELLQMAKAKSEAGNVAETASAGRVCPCCGKPMVLRVARHGAHAGSSFWGCSAYPECKGILAA